MPRTPLNRFEYPPAEYPLWKHKGLQRADLSEEAQRNIPPEIFEQEFDGFVDWLEQLEIQLTGMVNVRADLPEPDPEATVEYQNPSEDRATQRRLFVILHENKLVYDTGEEWATLAGRGRRDERMPPIHTEEVTANDADIDRLESEDVNAQLLRQRGNEFWGPELIEYYELDDAGTLDVSIDTREYDSAGDILLRGHFTTTSDRGPEDIHMQIAGYSQSQYRQTHLSGSGLNTPADQDSWRLGTLDQEFGQFACTYELSRPRQRPTIRGDAVSGSAEFTSETLYRGAVVGEDVFRITSVDLFTTGPITDARIEVYGKEHGEFETV